MQYQRVTNGQTYLTIAIVQCSAWQAILACCKKKLKTTSNTSVSVYLYLHTDSIVSKEYLRVVGKISCVYRSITAHVPEIPHLPIMVNVILTGISEASPASEKQRNTMHADHRLSADLCHQKRACRWPFLARDSIMFRLAVDMDIHGYIHGYIHVWIWDLGQIYPWILRWHNTIALNLCKIPPSYKLLTNCTFFNLSLIHIWRCRRRG